MSSNTSRTFVHKIKVTVDKYLHINTIIQLVRLLVAGHPANDFSQNAICFLEREAN